MEYTYVYCSSLGICFLLILMLLFYNVRYFKSGHINKLLYACIFVMCSLAMDIIWVFIEGKPKYSAFNYVINIIEVLSLSFIGYLWFLYCVERFSFSSLRTRCSKIIAFIPVALVNILALTTPFTGFIFMIDNEGVYTRGPLFFLQTIGYVYLFVCSVISAVEYKKSVLNLQKQKFLTMALFAVPASLLGTIQLLMPPGVLPTMEFSIYMALLMVFINEQQLRITVDSLTNLINRNEFERILNERIQHRSEKNDSPLFVLFGDLDDFKSVNDSYGHLEGDKALKSTASVIEHYAAKYGAVPGHIYGDEFVVMFDGCSDSAPADFVMDVNKAFCELNNKRNYSVNISFGIARFEPGMSVIELISAADHDMYRVKGLKKAVPVRL